MQTQVNCGNDDLFEAACEFDVTSSTALRSSLATDADRESSEGESSSTASESGSDVADAEHSIHESSLRRVFPYTIADVKKDCFPFNSLSDALLYIEDAAHKRSPQSTGHLDRGLELLRHTGWRWLTPARVTFAISCTLQSDDHLMMIWNLLSTVI